MGRSPLSLPLFRFTCVFWDYCNCFYVQVAAYLIWNCWLFRLLDLNFGTAVSVAGEIHLTINKRFSPQGRAAACLYHQCSFCEHHWGSSGIIVTDVLAQGYASPLNSHVSYSFLSCFMFRWRHEYFLRFFQAFLGIFQLFFVFLGI